MGWGSTGDNKSSRNWHKQEAKTMEKDSKRLGDERDHIERQRELDRMRTETFYASNNRKTRRRQAVIAKRRAKALVKAMRAQGVDFIHDKP